MRSAIRRASSLRVSPLHSTVPMTGISSRPSSSTVRTWSDCCPEVPVTGLPVSELYEVEELNGTASSGLRLFTTMVRPVEGLDADLAGLGDGFGRKVLGVLHIPHSFLGRAGREQASQDHPYDRVAERLLHDEMVDTVRRQDTGKTACDCRLILLIINSM